MQKIIIAMLIFFSCSLCVYAAESRAEKDAKDYLDFKAMLMANLKYIGEGDDEREVYSLPVSTIYDFFKKRKVNLNYIANYYNSPWHNGYSYLLLVILFLDEKNEEFYPLLEYILENGGESLITVKFDGGTAINSVEYTTLHDKSYENKAEKLLALEMDEEQIRLARFLINYCKTPTYKLLSKTFWRDATNKELVEALNFSDLHETVNVDDDYNRLDALDFAIRYGTDEQVKLVLRYYKDSSMYRTDYSGRTYLMKAAEYRGLAAVKALAEKKRFVRDLGFPLYINITVDEGALSTDIINNYKTALNYAELCEENVVLDCKMDVRRYLLSRMKNPTQKLLSHTYWMLVTPEELKRDIAAGADLKMYLDGAISPVKYAAAAAKDYELLEILLEAGAEKVFKCNTNSRSVADHVRLFRPYGDNDKMYKFLKDHGMVDIECQTSDYLSTKTLDEM